jgi:hypothetical protein
MLGDEAIRVLTKFVGPELVPVVLKTTEDYKPELEQMLVEALASVQDQLGRELTLQEKGYVCSALGVASGTHMAIMVATDRV